MHKAKMSTVNLRPKTPAPMMRMEEVGVFAMTFCRKDMNHILAENDNMIVLIEPVTVGGQN